MPSEELPVSSACRVLLTEEPYLPGIANCSWLRMGIWPCSWIGLHNRTPPFVAAYRLPLRLEESAIIRIHVTADERYELYLNGDLIGRGSERGDARNWYFESYELTLSAGVHWLTARVWAAGPASLRSQISLAPGFLLSPDDEHFVPLLGTGEAPWEAKELPGHSFERPFPHDFFSIGYSTLSDSKAMDWDWSSGQGEGWETVRKLHPGSSAMLRTRVAPTVHLLRPATLPPMREEVAPAGRVRYVGDKEGPIRKEDSISAEVEAWSQLLISGQPVHVAAGRFRRILIELNGYVCGYPEVSLRGGDGGKVKVNWAESLFLQPDKPHKGNRSEIEGKHFIGYGDTFLPSGDTPQEFTTCFWRAGRFVEIVFECGSVPMIVERFQFRSTRYPWDPESEFSASDSSLDGILELGVSVLKASTHDAIVDGPYYEQMMWAGDGVQSSLTSYVLTRDDRLIRKMLRLFDASRTPSGLTAARWPAKDLLIIAPYSLLWIGMVREYAFWRNDPAFVKSLLPGVRAVLSAFSEFETPEGLVKPAIGWNYIDAVPGWNEAMPPHSENGHGILSWQYVRILNAAAELEDAVGEPELAQLNRRKAGEIAAKLTNLLWRPEQGLFADLVQGDAFSEHCQAEAILSGNLDSQKLEAIKQALLTNQNLARTTIYYSHYLFETYQRLGCMDAFLRRLDLWRNLRDLGLCTTPENPEPTRSDCHAWGAHPVYHFFAGILGIRPGSPGFKTVDCRPQLGGLSWARGTMVHPQGEIFLRVEKAGSTYRGEIRVPRGVTGRLILPDRTLPLQSGSFS